MDTLLKQGKRVLWAVMPSVHLAKEAKVILGPVTFYAEKLFEAECTKEDLQTVKEFTEKDRQVTFLTIDETIPQAKWSSLAVDAIYLLYFAATFRDVFYDNEIISFKPFTQLIPIHHDPVVSEATTLPSCIAQIDQEITDALGEALFHVYSDHESDPHHFSSTIRAIRYFVDSFYERFENLHEQCLLCPGMLFEPEDMLFLFSSFDALYHLGKSNSPSDFKQKVRPQLHIKYSKPLEIFWKWVDGFYQLKQDTIQGKAKIETTFKGNPNFLVSYPYLGLKLFIYSIYFELFQSNLVTSDTSGVYEPINFKWIHPEEINLFFWSEEGLLRKILILVSQNPKKTQRLEERAVIHHLTGVYETLLDRFMFSANKNDVDQEVKFIPQRLDLLEPYIQPLLDFSRTGNGEILPESFVNHLKARRTTFCR